MSTTIDERARARRRFILGLLGVVGIAFLGIIRDFLVALLLASVFAGLLYPIQRRVCRGLGVRATPSAIATLLASLIAIGLPLTGLVMLVTAEAVEISEQIVPRMRELMTNEDGLAVGVPAWLPYSEPLVAAFESHREDALQNLADAARAAGRWLVAGVSGLTQSTLRFVLSFFVMVYAMFFFLRDGPALLEELGSFLPLDEDDRALVLDRGLSVTRATFKSILVIGALQGVLVGLGLWACGLSGAAFWATITLVLSAVPGLGAPLVWLPASVYLMLTDQLAWGIALAVWGALVVGSVDNLLRPMLVGRDTKLPDLVVLVSVLGGIGAFGAVGILLGPLLAGLLDTALEIYRRVFTDSLAPELAASDPPSDAAASGGPGRSAT